MRIIQISDTHNRHHDLRNMADADVIIHCGDFADRGTEREVLDFLNWFIALPYKYKIFVTGNHDLCLWDATGIEDLPENVYFLQDCGCEIEGVRFFGLGYNHSERLIPEDVDVLVTHEPPFKIMDETNGTHWGNELLRKRIFETKARFHFFGHAHEAYGTEKHRGIVFSNGAVLDDQYQFQCKPKVFVL